MALPAQPPASAPQQPRSLACPFSLAGLACPHIPRRYLRLPASVGSREAHWPFTLTHGSCWFAGHHCASVLRLTPAVGGSTARAPSRDLAVGRQGRTCTLEGGPCSRLPGHPSSYVCLDQRRSQFPGDVAITLRLSPSPANPVEPFQKGCSQTCRGISRHGVGTAGFASGRQFPWGLGHACLR